MLSPFLLSPVKIPYSLPPPPPPPCSPTNPPTPIPGPGIPLHWGIEPTKDQGLLLPLMTN